MLVFACNYDCKLATTIARKESLMSKDLKGNGHHLTLSDRIYIEQELLQNSSFRSIAATLHKDPSTISKEVKLHRHVPLMHEIKYPHCSSCNKYQSCMVSVDIIATFVLYSYSHSLPFLQVRLCFLRYCGLVIASSH